MLSKIDGKFIPYIISVNKGLKIGMKGVINTVSQVAPPRKGKGTVDEDC